MTNKPFFISCLAAASEASGIEKACTLGSADNDIRPCRVVTRMI